MPLLVAPLATGWGFDFARCTELEPEFKIPTLSRQVRSGQGWGTLADKFCWISGIAL